MEKKRSLRTGLLKNARRLSACFLAISMVCGSPLGGFPAWAKTDAGTGAYHTITFQVVDLEGRTEPPLVDLGTRPAGAYAGAPVSFPSPPAAVVYWKLAEVEIDQGTGDHLTAGADHSVTGTMPDHDVVIRYGYRKSDCILKIHWNGGSPDEEWKDAYAGDSFNPVETDFPGRQGEDVKVPEPVVTRKGYTFMGWTASRHSGSAGLSWPAKYNAFPEMDLYPVWKINLVDKFNLTVKHVSESGLVMKTEAPLQYSAESDIDLSKEPMKGYLRLPFKSRTDPEQFDYTDGARPVGSFDASDQSYRKWYQFTGQMPGGDLEVDYVYQVDESQKFNFNVEYKAGEYGPSLADGDSRRCSAEDPISCKPVEREGFQLVSKEITGGNTAGNTTYPVLGSFAEDGTFQGIMPNQNVSITYIYKQKEPGFWVRARYLDKDTKDPALKELETVKFGPYKGGQYVVQGAYQTKYGYQLTDKSSSNNFWIGLYPNGNWSGTMPTEDVDISYFHQRIPEKWETVNFAAGKGGTLEAGPELSPDVVQNGGEFSTSVLKSDGTLAGRSAGYTLNDLNTKHLMPEGRADDFHLPFAGEWFLDGNGNGVPDGDESVLPSDYQFTGSEAGKLTAYFQKDPAKWVTIHFEAGGNGHFTGTPVTEYEGHAGTRWSEIPNPPEGEADHNYQVDGWYCIGEPVTNDTLLSDGQTYQLRFKPDDFVFGTKVEAPEALGELNAYGAGKITLLNLTHGYQYILAEPKGPAGKILAVNRGNLRTTWTVFDGLYPGTWYELYEGNGKTKVPKGGMAGNITGDLSDPAKVLIPVVYGNCKITYEETEGTEVRTELTILPADNNSAYALLDENGRAVVSSKTDDKGWQTPDWSGAVAFTGLAYNKKYTAVARPRTMTGVTPESKREDGTVIVTDPGGEPEATDYTVQTLHGRIQSVRDQNGELKEPEEDPARYEKACKGDTVKITAAALNEKGERFSHWDVLIGAFDGFPERMEDREAAFLMPGGNVVLHAVYDKLPSAPSYAKVIGETRGRFPGRLVLDPAAASELSAELTTEDDRYLMDVNKADVSYRAVYKADRVKATESDAVKREDAAAQAHPQAYKGAWAIDVSLERYVNERRPHASPSDATPANATFKTYVQLGKNDVDMLDYRLYEVTAQPDTAEAPSVRLMVWDRDPENTAGLFSFEAKANSRYVLVYSKSYRVKFINKRVTADPSYSFKVRRGEALSESEWAGVPLPTQEYYDENTGAEYWWDGWSYRPSGPRAPFDPDRPVIRRTYVYAYYYDNYGEVMEVRAKLEAGVNQSIALSNDYFLTNEESNDLLTGLSEAGEVLRRYPRARLQELQAVLKSLQDGAIIEKYETILKYRYQQYHHMHDNGNKGGSSGGGGGGGGTLKNPYSDKKTAAFLLGTNGRWVKGSGPDGNESLKFVLNGGSPLSKIWARLYSPDGEGEGIGWYRFNVLGEMASGWISDAGKWYYCNTKREGNYGRMATGWRQDRLDGCWYYLDSDTGAMVTGLKEIGGKEYYFNEEGAGVYAFNPVSLQWEFTEKAGRPLGAMYMNEITPDGRVAGPDGAVLAGG